MKGSCTRRTDCRLCGSRALTLALPISASPIGDHYVPVDRLKHAQPSYPLDLFLCAACGHLQLLDVLPPDLLFGDYTFVTSSSPGLVEHFRRHAEDVVRRTTPPAAALVVEIGSNDGSLLRFYKALGLRTLGVDPAAGIAAQASASGIETIPTFFTREVAETMRRERGAATLVEANNVYAHVDDIAGLTDGVRLLLAPDGVFVFEVSYLVDTIEKKLFDTVYHEHLSYHSLAPLMRFFAAHGLELFDVERIPTKGGSIRGFVQLHGGPRPRTAAVDELLRLEQTRGMARVETFRAFADDLAAVKGTLHHELSSIRAGGGEVAGFGASVTVTTLLHHFSLGGMIDYLVDDNPAKQGLYSPGLHLPVRPSQAIHERPPAAVVILAWQYADAIMKKHARYLDTGGRFLVPLPEARIVPSAAT
jgi:SAM-dependent methyltransferase